MRRVRFYGGWSQKAVKWGAIFGENGPKLLHLRAIPSEYVEILHLPCYYRGKKGHFSINVDFTRDVTRFPRPRMETGFRKRQDPVTRYGLVGHFRPQIPRNT